MNPQELKKLALAATPGSLKHTAENDAFRSAANPAAVLELIGRYEEALSACKSAAGLLKSFEMVSRNNFANLAAEEAETLELLLAKAGAA